MGLAEGGIPPGMFLLLVQLIATLAMFGLIWFVQVVHYPLFELVDDRKFAASHATRTTYVVAPLMLLELASSIALLRTVWRPSFISPTEAWLGAVLAGVIWLSTAFLQVPMHDRLQARHSVADARQLVATNWVRTVAWSLRAALVLLWAWRCGTIAAASLK